jgi:hypothetical protein
MRKGKLRLIEKRKQARALEKRPGTSRFLRNIVSHVAAAKNVCADDELTTINL